MRNKNGDLDKLIYFKTCQQYLETVKNYIKRKRQEKEQIKEKT